MKYTITLMATVIAFSACQKTTKDTPSGLKDRLAIVTNINSGATPVAYVGTLKDLSPGSYTNTKARQTTTYPFIFPHGNDLIVSQNRVQSILTKYSRENGGTLAEGGRLVFSSNALPIAVAYESDTKAYCTLQNEGKIAVFNPATMTLIRYIDLTSYALGDASPDPAGIIYRNGKLYVCLVQTSNGYTSMHPAQMLIIDVNTERITSITDNRTTWAGSADSPHSLFFDEQGDLYVFCVASYGFVPGQKCGFLRIRNGASTFDPTYFFNITDYQIAGIPGNTVNYFNHMYYGGNGIVYSTGNIPALMSNPPDYVNDRTFASFRVDVNVKTVQKIELPYSNGYAAHVSMFEGKVLFGLSTTKGVGIFTYDLSTGVASATPVVATQGDPSIIEVFE